MRNWSWCVFSKTAVIILLLNSSVFSSELILNGDFSSTNPSYIPQWVTAASSSSYYPYIHTGVIQPDTNPGNVVVAPGNSQGGYSTSYLQQYLYIPRDSLGTTLTFYYQWQSAYLFGTQMFADAYFGGIELMREQGNGDLIQPAPTPGWTRVDTYINLQSYGGQSVTLRFRAYDDGIADANYILLDDISMDVITATITNTPSVTPVLTATPTLTISVTNTPTWTSTNTPELTKTNTTTFTMTETYTKTPTFTHSPTVTPTPTITKTVSPTPSITPTYTSTPTITITATGSATISPTCTATQTATPQSGYPDVDLQGHAVLPLPNPAGDRMQFVMNLAHDARIDIVIYNPTGERIATVTQEQTAGRGRSVTWDCSGATPGIYWVRVLLNGKENAKLKVAVER